MYLCIYCLPSQVKRSVPRDQMAPPEPSSRGGGRDDRRGDGAESQQRDQLLI